LCSISGNHLAKGGWAGNIAASDKIHNQILEIDGMLTEGIAAQFPDQFKQVTSLQDGLTDHVSCQPAVK